MQCKIQLTKCSQLNFIIHSRLMHNKCRFKMVNILLRLIMGYFTITFHIDFLSIKVKLRLEKSHNRDFKMIKLKFGTIPRLFLCVYLELMNITVDEMQLTPFRKSSRFQRSSKKCRMSKCLINENV